MRGRLLWFLLVTNALNLLSLVVTFAFALLFESGVMDMLGRAGGEPMDAGSYAALRLTLWISFALSVPWVAAYAWAIVRVWRRPIDREGGLRLAYWLIVAPTALTLFCAAFAYAVFAPMLGIEEEAWRPFVRELGWNNAGTVLFMHVLASLFLPWSPRNRCARWRRSSRSTR